MSPRFPSVVVLLVSLGMFCAPAVAQSCDRDDYARIVDKKNRDPDEVLRVFACLETLGWPKGGKPSAFINVMDSYFYCPSHLQAWAYLQKGDEDGLFSVMSQMTAAEKDRCGKTFYKAEQQMVQQVENEYDRLAETRRAQQLTGLQGEAQTACDQVSPLLPSGDPLGPRCAQVASIQARNDLTRLKRDAENALQDLAREIFNPVADVGGIPDCVRGNPPDPAGCAQYLRDVAGTYRGQLQDAIAAAERTAARSETAALKQADPGNAAADEYLQALDDVARMEQGFGTPPTTSWVAIRDYLVSFGQVEAVAAGLDPKAQAVRSQAQGKIAELNGAIQARRQECNAARPLTGRQDVSAAASLRRHCQSLPQTRDGVSLAALWTQYNDMMTALPDVAVVATMAKTELTRSAGQAEAWCGGNPDLKSPVDANLQGVQSLGGRPLGEQFRQLADLSRTLQTCREGACAPFTTFRDAAGALRNVGGGCPAERQTLVAALDAFPPAGRCNGQDAQLAAARDHAAALTACHRNALQSTGAGIAREVDEFLTVQEWLADASDDLEGKARIEAAIREIRAALPAPPTWPEPPADRDGFWDKDGLWPTFLTDWVAVHEASGATSYDGSEEYLVRARSACVGAALLRVGELLDRSPGEVSGFLADVASARCKVPGGVSDGDEYENYFRYFQAYGLWIEAGRQGSAEIRQLIAQSTRLGYDPNFEEAFWGGSDGAAGGAPPGAGGGRR